MYKYIYIYIYIYKKKKSLERGRTRGDRRWCSSSTARRGSAAPARSPPARPRSTLRDDACFRRVTRWI